MKTSHVAFVALSLLAACGDAGEQDLNSEGEEGAEEALKSGAPFPTLVHLYDTSLNDQPEFVYLQQGISLSTSLTPNGAFALIGNDSRLPLTLEGLSISVECSNNKRGGTDNMTRDVPDSGLLIETRCPSGSTPKTAILAVTSFVSASVSNAYHNPNPGSPGQGRYYHSNFPTELMGDDGSTTTLELGKDGNTLVGTFRNLTTSVLEINYSLSASCPGKKQADVVQSGPRSVDPYETTTIELHCDSGRPRYPLFDIAGWHTK
jgi:hypothetical protein